MAGGDGHDRSSALRLRLTGLVPRPNSAALVRPCAAGSAEALGSGLGPRDGIAHSGSGAQSWLRGGGRSDRQAGRSVPWGQKPSFLFGYLSRSPV